MSFNPSAPTRIDDFGRPVVVGPPFPAARPSFPWLNVILFLATIVSTLLVGMFMMLSFEGQTGVLAGGFIDGIRQNPALLARGLPFCLALISILLSHEMGHYLTCRYYGIQATLPYFIPAPTLVGTFGAFIRIRSPIQHRSALFEVGIAGPIAGFVVALPVLAYSLTQTRYVPVDSEVVRQGISLGDPLIFSLFEWLMGRAAPPGTEAYIHPVGFAAWVGFLVTALNLLPVGQLDGGHICFALSSRLHWWISRMFVFALVAMGYFYWPGWWVWALLLLILGVRHPPTLDDSRPLEERQRVLAWVALAIFILSFTPAPIH